MSDKESLSKRTLRKCVPLLIGAVVVELILILLYSTLPNDMLDVIEILTVLMQFVIVFILVPVVIALIAYLIEIAFKG